MSFFTRTPSWEPPPLVTREQRTQRGDGETTAAEAPVLTPTTTTTTTALQRGTRPGIGSISILCSPASLASMQMSPSSSLTHVHGGPGGGGGGSLQLYPPRHWRTRSGPRAVSVCSPVEASSPLSLSGSCGGQWLRSSTRATHPPSISAHIEDKDNARSASTIATERESSPTGGSGAAMSTAPVSYTPPSAVRVSAGNTNRAGNHAVPSHTRPISSEGLNDFMAVVSSSTFTRMSDPMQFSPSASMSSATLGLDTSSCTGAAAPRAFKREAVTASMPTDESGRRRSGSDDGDAADERAGEMGNAKDNAMGSGVEDGVERDHRARRDTKEGSNGGARPCNAPQNSMTGAELSKIGKKHDTFSPSGTVHKVGSAIAGLAAATAVHSAQAETAWWDSTASLPYLGPTQYAHFSDHSVHRLRTGTSSSSNASGQRVVPCFRTRHHRRRRGAASNSSSRSSSASSSRASSATSSLPSSDAASHRSSPVGFSALSAREKSPTHARQTEDSVHTSASSSPHSAARTPPLYCGEEEVTASMAALQPSMPPTTTLNEKDGDDASVGICSEDTRGIGGGRRGGEPALNSQTKSPHGSPSQVHGRLQQRREDAIEKVAGATRDAAYTTACRGSRGAMVATLEVGRQEDDIDGHGFNGKEVCAASVAAPSENREKEASDKRDEDRPPQYGELSERAPQSNLRLHTLSSTSSQAGSMMNATPQSDLLFVADGGVNSQGAPQKDDSVSADLCSHFAPLSTVGDLEARSAAHIGTPTAETAAASATANTSSTAARPPNAAPGPAIGAPSAPPATTCVGKGNTIPSHPPYLFNVSSLALPSPMAAAGSLSPSAAKQRSSPRTPRSAREATVLKQIRVAIIDARSVQGHLEELQALQPKPAPTAATGCYRSAEAGEEQRTTTPTTSEATTRTTTPREIHTARGPGGHGRFAHAAAMPSTSSVGTEKDVGEDEATANGNGDEDGAARDVTEKEVEEAHTTEDATTAVFNVGGLYTASLNGYRQQRLTRLTEQHLQSLWQNANAAAKAVCGLSLEQCARGALLEDVPVVQKRALGLSTDTFSCLVNTVTEVAATSTPSGSAAGAVVGGFTPIATGHTFQSEPAPTTTSSVAASASCDATRKASLPRSGVPTPPPLLEGINGFVAARPSSLSPVLTPDASSSSSCKRERSMRGGEGRSPAAQITAQAEGNRVFPLTTFQRTSTQTSSERDKGSWLASLPQPSQPQQHSAPYSHHHPLHQFQQQQHLPLSRDAAAAARASSSDLCQTRTTQQTRTTTPSRSAATDLTYRSHISNDTVSLWPSFPDSTRSAVSNAQQHTSPISPNGSSTSSASFNATASTSGTIFVHNSPTSLVSGVAVSSSLHDMLLLGALGVRGEVGEMGSSLSGGGVNSPSGSSAGGGGGGVQGGTGAVCSAFSSPMAPIYLATFGVAGGGNVVDNNASSPAAQTCVPRSYTLPSTFLAHLRTHIGHEGQQQECGVEVDGGERGGGEVEGGESGGRRGFLEQFLTPSTDASVTLLDGASAMPTAPTANSTATSPLPPTASAAASSPVLTPTGAAVEAAHVGGDGLASQHFFALHHIPHTTHLRPPPPSQAPLQQQQQQQQSSLTISFPPRHSPTSSWHSELSVVGAGGGANLSVSNAPLASSWSLPPPSPIPPPPPAAAQRGAAAAAGWGGPSCPPPLSNSSSQSSPHEAAGSGAGGGPKNGGGGSAQQGGPSSPTFPSLMSTPASFSLASALSALSAPPVKAPFIKVQREEVAADAVPGLDSSASISLVRRAAAAAAAAAATPKGRGSISSGQRSDSRERDQQHTHQSHTQLAAPPHCDTLTPMQTLTDSPVFGPSHHRRREVSAELSNAKDSPHGADVLLRASGEVGAESCSTATTATTTSLTRLHVGSSSEGPLRHPASPTILLPVLALTPYGLRVDEEMTATLSIHESTESTFREQNRTGSATSSEETSAAPGLAQLHRSRSGSLSGSVGPRAAQTVTERVIAFTVNGTVDGATTIAEQSTRSGLVELEMLATSNSMTTSTSASATPMTRFSAGSAPSARSDELDGTGPGGDKGGAASPHTLLPSPPPPPSSYHPCTHAPTGLSVSGQTNSPLASSQLQPSLSASYVSPRGLDASILNTDSGEEDDGRRRETIPDSVEGALKAHASFFMHANEAEDPTALLLPLQGCSTGRAATSSISFSLSPTLRQDAREQLVAKPSRETPPFALSFQAPSTTFISSSAGELKSMASATDAKTLPPWRGASAGAVGTGMDTVRADLTGKGMAIGRDSSIIDSADRHVSKQGSISASSAAPPPQECVSDTDRHQQVHKSESSSPTKRDHTIGPASRQLLHMQGTDNSTTSLPSSLPVLGGHEASPPSLGTEGTSTKGAAELRVEYLLQFSSSSPSQLLPRLTRSPSSPLPIPSSNSTLNHHDDEDTVTMIVRRSTSGSSNSSRVGDVEHGLVGVRPMNESSVGSGVGDDVGPKEVEGQDSHDALGQQAASPSNLSADLDCAGSSAANRYGDVQHPPLCYSDLSSRRQKNFREHGWGSSDRVQTAGVLSSCSHALPDALRDEGRKQELKSGEDLVAAMVTTDPAAHDAYETDGACLSSTAPAKERSAGGKLAGGTRDGPASAPVASGELTPHSDRAVNAVSMLSHSSPLLADTRIPVFFASLGSSPVSAPAGSAEQPPSRESTIAGGSVADHLPPSASISWPPAGAIMLNAAEQPSSAPSAQRFCLAEDSPGERAAAPAAHSPKLALGEGSNDRFGGRDDCRIGTGDAQVLRSPPSEATHSAVYTDPHFMEGENRERRQRRSGDREDEGGVVPRLQSRGSEQLLQIPEMAEDTQRQDRLHSVTACLPNQAALAAQPQTSAAYERQPSHTSDEDVHTSCEEESVGGHGGDANHGKMLDAKADDVNASAGGGGAADATAVLQASASTLSAGTPRAVSGHGHGPCEAVSDSTQGHHRPRASTLSLSPQSRRPSNPALQLSTSFLNISSSVPSLGTTSMHTTISGVFNISSAANTGSNVLMATTSSTLTSTLSATTTNATALSGTPVGAVATHTTTIPMSSATTTATAAAVAVTTALKGASVGSESPAPTAAVASSSPDATSANASAAAATAAAAAAATTSSLCDLPSATVTLSSASVTRILERTGSQRGLSTSPTRALPIILRSPRRLFRLERPINEMDSTSSFADASAAGGGGAGEEAPLLFDLTTNASTASASTTVLGRLQPLPPLPPFQNYPFPLPRESSYDADQEAEDEEEDEEDYEDDFEAEDEMEEDLHAPSGAGRVDNGAECQLSVPKGTQVHASDSDVSDGAPTDSRAFVESSANANCATETALQITALRLPRIDRDVIAQAASQTHAAEMSDEPAATVESEHMEASDVQGEVQSPRTPRQQLYYTTPAISSAASLGSAKADASTATRSAVAAEIEKDGLADCVADASTVTDVAALERTERLSRSSCDVNSVREGGDGVDEGEESVLDDRVPTDLRVAPLNDDLVEDDEDDVLMAISVDGEHHPHRSSSSPFPTVPNISLPTLPIITTPRGTGGGVSGSITGAGGGTATTGAASAASAVVSCGGGGGVGGGAGSNHTSPRGAVPRMPSPLLSSRSPRQHLVSPLRPVGDGGGGGCGALGFPAEGVEAASTSGVLSVRRSGGESSGFHQRSRPRAHTDSPLRRSTLPVSRESEAARPCEHERRRRRADGSPSSDGSGGTASEDLRFRVGANNTPPKQRSSPLHGSSSLSRRHHHRHAYQRHHDKCEEVYSSGHRRSGSGGSGGVRSSVNSAASFCSSGVPRQLHRASERNGSGIATTPIGLAGAGVSALRLSFPNEMALSELSALGRSRSGQSQEGNETPLSAYSTEGTLLPGRLPRSVQFQCLSPPSQTAAPGELWAGPSPLASASASRATSTANATAARRTTATTASTTTSTSSLSALHDGSQVLMPIIGASRTTASVATTAASAQFTATVNTVSSTTARSLSPNASFPSAVEAPLPRDGESDDEKVLQPASGETETASAVVTRGTAVEHAARTSPSLRLSPHQAELKSDIVHDREDSSEMVCADDESAEVATEAIMAERSTTVRLYRVSVDEKATASTVKSTSDVGCPLRRSSGAAPDEGELNATGEEVRSSVFSHRRCCIADALQLDIFLGDSGSTVVEEDRDRNRATITTTTALGSTASTPRLPQPSTPQLRQSSWSAVTVSTGTSIADGPRAASSVVETPTVRPGGEAESDSEVGEEDCDLEFAMEGEEKEQEEEDSAQAGHHTHGDVHISNSSIDDRYAEVRSAEKMGCAHYALDGDRRGNAECDDSVVHSIVSAVERSQASRAAALEEKEKLGVEGARGAARGALSNLGVSELQSQQATLQGCLMECRGPQVTLRTHMASAAASLEDSTSSPCEVSATDVGDTRDEDDVEMDCVMQMSPSAVVTASTTPMHARRGFSGTTPSLPSPAVASGHPMDAGGAEGQNPPQILMTAGNALGSLNGAEEEKPREKVGLATARAQVVVADAPLTPPTAVSASVHISPPVVQCTLPPPVVPFSASSPSVSAAAAVRGGGIVSEDKDGEGSDALPAPSSSTPTTSQPHTVPPTRYTSSLPPYYLAQCDDGLCDVKGSRSGWHATTSAFFPAPTAAASHSATITFNAGVRSTSSSSTSSSRPSNLYASVSALARRRALVRASYERAGQQPATAPCPGMGEETSISTQFSAPAADADSTSGACVRGVRAEGVPVQPPVASAAAVGRVASYTDGVSVDNTANSDARLLALMRYTVDSA